MVLRDPKAVIAKFFDVLRQFDRTSNRFTGGFPLPHGDKVKS